MKFVTVQSRRSGGFGELSSEGAFTSGYADERASERTLVMQRSLRANEVKLVTGNPLKFRR